MVVNLGSVCCYIGSVCCYGGSVVSHGQSVGLAEGQGATGSDCCCDYDTIIWHFPGYNGLRGGI